MEWALPHHPTYLWTLPLFHCNGWCFPWTVAAVAGTNVCLRGVEAAQILEAIQAEGVTHMCGAPIVLNMVTTEAERRGEVLGRTVRLMTAGAAPPAAVLERGGEVGFDVTHVYGLTECYGPNTVCAWHPEWSELPAAEQATLKARQGVTYVVQEELTVLDPETMEPVPADAETIGEVMMRGNVLMKGYLKNPTATEAAFEGGYFHTGDLAVLHPDGYIEIRDRSKDIIISGGENISSIEVEGVLYRHPAVSAAAVVARPDEHWGETPCAFVELKQGAKVTDRELMEFCRQHMAKFKAPRAIVFGELPKTSTGKIQKFVLREKAKSASAIE
jgi:fatty-acyl-CoA synthase